MSKERELLEKVLLTFSEDALNQLCCEIRDLLAQPEQEPVAWMYDWNIKGEEEYGNTKYDALTRSESITNNRAITNIRPLYTSPQKREPLSDDEVCKELKLSRRSTEWDYGFEAGVGFAEEFHCIGNR